MSLLATRPVRARLLAHARGFAGFHAVNAGLSIVYTLAQTLVFSRVLDARTFSQTVAIQAASLYLLPLNQAVARANFVLLRETTVRRDSDGAGEGRGAPEAAAAFQLSSAVLLVAPFLIPPLIGSRSGRDYVSMVALLFFCTYSNLWYSEMQMTMMAINRALRFERYTLLRRLINYASLVWLFLHRDFLAFNLVLAVQTAAFHLVLLFDGVAARELFGWPRGVTSPALRAHVKRLWLSAQATFAEWLTLNGPYMVFTARFGIGPALVAVDAVLKLLRMVVSVTRNLSEIALPGVSRAVLQGAPRRGRPAAALVLAGGGLAAGILALLVGLAPTFAFNLLLGHNNTVPAAAGAPAALALVSGVGFAAGAHLVGHTGHARSIRRIMAMAAVGIVFFAVYVLGTHAAVTPALWAFAGVFAAVSLATAVLLARLLSGVAVTPPALEPAR